MIFCEAKQTLKVSGSESVSDQKKSWRQRHTVVTEEARVREEREKKEE